MKWIVRWLIFCLLFQKIYCLLQFNFLYADNDQLVYWSMLRDFSNGIFHEPYFYGQNYNFPLEAWFSVPFYKLGIPANIILPIITVLFSITPFFIIIYQLRKKGHYLSATVLLFCLCCMSIQYDLICSIPRGFVQAIFIASLALPLISRANGFTLFLSGFLLSIAYVVNPNSLFLSICIVFLMAVQNKNEKRLIHLIFFAVGILPSLYIYWNFNQFYQLNSNFNLHYMQPLGYEFKDTISRLQSLDSFWTGLTPFIWHFASLNLLFFAGFIYYFIKTKQKRNALFTIVLFLMILLSIGLSKCADGSISFLFPYSRFYLTLPVVFGLLLLIANLNFKTPKITFNKYLLILIPLTATAYTVYKTVHLKAHFQQQFRIDAGIQIIKVSDLKRKCNSMKKIMREQQINLLIFADRDDKLDYGCPCIWDNDSLLTLGPQYERRSWRMEQESRMVRPRFMLCFWDDYKVTHIDSTYLPINHHLFIIREPGLPAVEWLKNKQYLVRPYILKDSSTISTH